MYNYEGLVALLCHFFEAFRKMAMQYYPDKINSCKDVFSISMTSILNKSLVKDSKLDLHAAGSICQI